MNNKWIWYVLLGALVASGCEGSSGAGDGGGDEPPPDAPIPCEETFDFRVEGEGHPEPLGSAAGEARAGRVAAGQLPEHPHGLLRWREGDWVLANDRVAVVIEDVGPSDFYDPWGGKPVGIALMRDGEMVDPADFGELLFLVEAHSLFTQTVGVVNDGSDGEAAIIRASGRLAPLPFMDQIASLLFQADLSDIEFAIDYILRPNSNTVEVHFRQGSTRSSNYTIRTVLYGFMFTYRMPAWSPGFGYGLEGEEVPWLAFIDRVGASYAYTTPDTELASGPSVSGFQGRFGKQTITIPACSESTRHYASLTIGGPGLDGVVAAVAEANSEATRTITGVVRDSAGLPIAGARVHVTDEDGGHLTESTCDESGEYRVTVPAAAEVRLFAYREGDEAVGPSIVGPDTSTQDLMFTATGLLQVRAVEAGGSLDRTIPARIQVRSLGTAPTPPMGTFGEETPAGDRFLNILSADGDESVDIPPGRWEVIVSRGYEYEVVTEEVEVRAGETSSVVAELFRSVPTPGVMCADFHIHTHRSNDSGDPGAYKVAGAVADGLEIPVRSDHEYVGDFQPLIEEMGLTEWAHGISSVELTTMQVFGHFGVIPARPDDEAINGGAPAWQRWPTVDNPEQSVENMLPGELFRNVRARPEAPALIINHPRGGTNFFDVAGYDPMTGTVENPDYWDESFSAVEVFNDSGWQRNRDGTVQDWLSFLNHGRRVFAVGSSDSHGLRTSPIGYPRTCLSLGSDDPRDVTPDAVRDAMASGRSTISGGIYVQVRSGDATSGMDADGVGELADVEVSIHAASWVDVDTLELVVDGVTAETVAIRPEDASMDEPTLRFQETFQVPVGASGSYVIAAAYGDAPLAPVHPRRTPFGVTNPLFLNR